MFEISRLSVYPSLTHSSTALSGEDRVSLYEALLLAVGADEMRRSIPNHATLWVIKLMQGAITN